jgi:non-heme chloroperoxidase
MPTVNAADGTRLYVKDWGSGRPVVLIHGWPLSADSWDSQATAIASAGFRVIAYDRRGFGRSEQPWNGYDYDTLADDLKAVIDDRQLKDATLVGFSMGGGEVARYLSRHRGQGIIKAALVSSVVPYLLKTDDNPNGVPLNVLDGIAGGIGEDRAKFFQSFFKDFFGVGVISHPVSDAVLQWAWLQAMQGSLRSTLACAKAFGMTDFRADLPSFNVPTLIVHGTGDKTVPIDATGREAAKAIRQAKALEYDGAPHGLFITEKDRLTDDLLSLLRM